MGGISFLKTNNNTQWSNANKVVSLLLPFANLIEIGLLTNLHLSGVYNMTYIVSVIIQHVFISFLPENSSFFLKHYLIASYHLLELKIEYNIKLL